MATKEHKEHKEEKTGKLPNAETRKIPAKKCNKPKGHNRLTTNAFEFFVFFCGVNPVSSFVA